MDKILRNILVEIENAGYEAYLVGGYVRDYLLGIKSLDVDICTNALPKDLHKLFPNNNNANNYGGFNLQIKNYNVDITTYRKELKYENRKPVEIIYIDSLEEDLKRRDFTINTVCMDKDENIIDLLNGIQDINNCTIKIIGNSKERLEEDPLRIFRAIRFATVLNFKIEENLFKEIKNNYRLIARLSFNRIKQELNKILLSKNFLVGLKLLKEAKILDLLNITYNEDIVYVKDISGMWAQLEVKEYFAFTKQEIRNIINIRKIVKSGVVDNKTLYNFGLYNSLIAGEILNLNTKEINQMYKKLTIKSIKDLDISSKEIMTILNIPPSKKIKDIEEELVAKILEGKLKNNNKDLQKYLLKIEKR